MQVLGVIQASVMGPAGIDEQAVVDWIDAYAVEAGPQAPSVTTVVIGSSLYLLHLPGLDKEGEAWDAKVLELAGRRIYLDNEDDDEATYSGLRADLHLLRSGYGESDD